MLMILPGRSRGDALLHERLRRKEHAFEVDVEHRVEVVLRDIPKGRVLFDARVVHQHVEPAECLGASRDQVAHFADRSEIGANDGAATAERLDLGQRFFGAPGVAVVVDDDVRAFLREADGDAAADALCCCR